MLNNVFFSHSSSVLKFSSQWCQNYSTIWTARLLIASILLLPLNSVLRTNLTLLLYSLFDVLFHFSMLNAITLIYMFLVQLLFACVFIYVSMFLVKTSLFSYELAEAHFSRSNSILMSSLNIYLFIYFFILCYFICHTIKYN